MFVCNLTISPPPSLDSLMVQVGTEFTRGVSGGERKRVNIGMELINKPGVLFLDEPTTGLDSSTAQSVISLLHRCSIQYLFFLFTSQICFSNLSNLFTLSLFFLQIKFPFLRGQALFTFSNVSRIETICHLQVDVTLM